MAVAAAKKAAKEAADVAKEAAAEQAAKEAADVAKEAAAEQARLELLEETMGSGSDLGDDESDHIDQLEETNDSCSDSDHGEDGDFDFEDGVVTNAANDDDSSVPLETRLNGIVKLSYSTS